MSDSPKQSTLDWDLANLPTGIVWGGADEAGRGAWAGPVVAAAVALDRETAKKWRNVLGKARDSKTLSPEKRSAMAMELKAILPSWSASIVDNRAIDRDNILEATMAAMRQAIRELTIVPALVLIDGNHAPSSGLRERTLIDGDAISCAIACASILAKTYRDELMAALDAVYPQYGFARHKGYGTKAHQEAIRQHGPCPIHRMSYRPLREIAALNS
jgi:ribonuclease HII